MSHPWAISTSDKEVTFKSQVPKPHGPSSSHTAPGCRQARQVPPAPPHPATPGRISAPIKEKTGLQGSIGEAGVGGQDGSCPTSQGHNPRAIRSTSDKKRFYNWTCTWLLFTTSKSLCPDLFSWVTFW